MSKKEFTIYESHPDFDYEEMRKEYREFYQDLIFQDSEISDDDILEYVSYTSELDYEDEVDNLTVTLDGKILAIADLGLWNGRVNGYDILSNNLSDILTRHNADRFMLYSDGRDILKTATHHDGTNYIVYREIKNMDNIENLISKIYDNKEITRSTLNYYTKSLLPAVRAVYGM
ncbi:MAG: hypothetical protein M0R03_22790 [Novosphingobium sp.]|nr:hypothetical protein [Novosphingobium sp.]